MSGDFFASIYSPPAALKPWRVEDLAEGFEWSFFSYARRALAEGLRAAGVGLGARVLLPEFICRELLSSIVAVGAHPVFYPVGKDLVPSSHPFRWPEASAVVAVDYFGFPQDLEAFRTYCARTGALLIEDNAHGLFSRDDRGAPLGTRADVGLFSLRKTLPIPDGAVLALKTDARKWRLAPQSSFNEYTTRGQRIKNTLRRLSVTFGAPPVFHALQVFRTARACIDEGRPSGGEETDLPVPDLPCSVLASPITAADPNLEVQRRRVLYHRIEALLAPHVSPVFPSLREGVVPYGFAYRSTQSNEVARILSRVSLASLSWPNLPEAVSSAAPRHYRDVRFVPFLFI